MADLGLRGVGLAWRPELAAFLARREPLGFVEVLAERHLGRPVPAELDQLRARGVPVVPHGVSLSLGGAEPLERGPAAALGRLARRLGAPLVSEHVAFVRAGGLTSGHLLPVPRTREALAVLVENVRAAQEALEGVPLALENPAALFEWPGAELDEGAFLAELLERTGALLLLDLANLHANALNLGWDPLAVLARLPLERVAYVHLAGGSAGCDGLWHDTHTHPVGPAVLELLAALRERAAPEAPLPVPAPQAPLPVLVEWDGGFPSDAALSAELDAVAGVLAGAAA